MLALGTLGVMWPMKDYLLGDKASLLRWGVTPQEGWWEPQRGEKYEKTRLLL